MYGCNFPVKIAPMFFLYLTLAVGGALGACLRYSASSWVMRVYPGYLSHGTLAVNVIGSLFIGILFVLIQDKAHLPETYKPFLMTGLMGSFTTFSTFSLETIRHLTDGQYLHAISYVVLSILLCLSACFIGIFITRLF